MSESCCQVVVLLGYPRPSLAGIGVAWVLTGTHRCALVPRVASRQSGKPSLCVCWCCWGCDIMCSLRSSSWSCFTLIATENTYTPARLEAQALSRHHSYHPGFEVHVFQSLQTFSCRDRSAVLCSSKFVLRLAIVQALCNPARVVLELHRLDEISVPLLSFLVHVIHDLALPHDVLQHRLVFVGTCP